MEARLAALDFGGSLINEMKDRGGSGAWEENAKLHEALKRAEEEARNWRAR